MSYSIYYNRAFIQVGENYIPLVCSGANNVSDFVKGRNVREKNWSVLNWKRRDRVLFSKSEICEIAKDYEDNHQQSGMSFKSYRKPFATGEFERWIINGMKSACTVEEYISAGNKLFVVDYPNGMVERWRLQPFSTETELLTTINQFGAGHEFDISFGASRTIYRPIRRKVREDRLKEGGFTLARSES